MKVKKEFPDLHQAARVSHETYGDGTVISRFGGWTFGQVLVQYDNGKRIWTNPRRLSTEDGDK